MYAIIRTGGKQYRVAQGDTIYVERLEAPVGGQVTLGEVLFVGGGDKGETKVGAPLIDKASVAATVVDLGRDHKVRSSSTRSASTTGARAGTGSPLRR